MATLDLTPKSVDLKLYVGDDPRVFFYFWTDATKTATFDVSAYTAWVATIKTAAGATTAFAVDTSQAAVGLIVLQLNGDTVRNFQSKGCRWDFAAVDASGREITFARGRVTVREDVSVGGA